MTPTRYHGEVDVVIGLVVVGCAITGLVWGVLRMATLAAAAVGGIAAARFVAPTALALVAPARVESSNAQAVAALGVALITAILVMVAGRGLRRGVEFLRLGWLDRLSGAALAAAGAVGVLALLLALAANGGMKIDSPWAGRLARLGASWLGFQHARINNTTPTTTPAAATPNGQHPH